MFRATNAPVAAPFIIASQGVLQDRVVFGPKAILRQQQALIEWMYRDFRAGERSTGFRLGYLGGMAIAARICPVELKESISSRLDGVLILGLMSVGSTPAALCEALGLLARPLAQVSLTGEIGDPNQPEDEILANLARHIGETEVNHDWSHVEFLANRLCRGAPGTFLSPLSKIRKMFGRKNGFAAVLSGDAPTSLSYCIASEIWIRHARRDITIILDRSSLQGDGRKVFFEATLESTDPLVICQTMTVSFRGTPVNLLSIE